jgi:hypothetical protein
MSVNDNVEQQIIANMRTHFLPLLKDSVRTLGNSLAAKSVFSGFDTDKSGDLTQAEIDENLPNIDTILIQAKKDDSEASDYFGEKYTQASKNVDKASNKTVSEQIFENNLKEVVAMIINYAKAHPDDEQVQIYAKKAEEMFASGNILLTDIEEKGAIGEHIIDKESGEQKILIDNFDNLKSLDKNYMLQVLLHELGHAMSGDSLDSKQEESDVERVSRELISKITGIEIFKSEQKPITPEDIDEALLSRDNRLKRFSAILQKLDTPKQLLYFENIDKFIEQYNSYPEVSPSHGLPSNAGVALKYKPQEIREDNNMLIITSSPLADMKGIKIEERITFGDAVDSDGKKIPVSAKRVYIDGDGVEIASVDYGEYDPKNRAFDNKKLVISQLSLESKLNPEKFNSNLNALFGQS